MAFINVASWTCPDGHAAIVTSVYQALESLAAYEDCTVRMFWRGEEDEWWRPKKPEVAPVRIALWEEESIILQVENTSMITHYIDVELVGYVFRMSTQAKSQRGIRVSIGAPIKKS